MIKGCLAIPVRVNEELQEAVPRYLVSQYQIFSTSSSPKHGFSVYLFSQI
jgi:hypothetical protein